MNKYDDEEQELVPEATPEGGLAFDPKGLSLPPEPGTPGDHNDDCLGVDGDPEDLPEGDAEDEEGTEL